MKKKTRYIGPWRRTFQWATTLLLVAIPFIRINGGSLLRFDLASLSMHLGGFSFSIEDLYMFWMFCIGLVFLFLILTLVLGRVWCGWACPQTTLTDLSEGFARLIGMRVNTATINGSGWQKTVFHFFVFLLSLLVGANLVWYFVSPYAFFPALIEGTLGSWPLGIILTIAFLVYADIVFIRRLLCREFCPYGRFQTVLIDRGTLNLRYKTEEDERCIQCGACVRICPQGIDIKEGYQIECINCAQCLDACRAVMAPRDQDGLITYSFGTHGQGWPALFSPRLALVSLVFIVVSTGLLFAALNRSQIIFKLSRAPQAAVRYLDDGSSAIVYIGYLFNRSNTPQTVSLSGTLAGGETIRLMGPVEDINLARGERKQLTFAIVIDQLSSKQGTSATIRVSNAEKKELLANEILLPTTVIQ